MRSMRVLAAITVFVVLLLALPGPAGASPPPLGEGWAVQRPADGGNTIACADASRVVAVGGTSVVMTSDGGNTWSVQTLGSTGGLQDVFFLDSAHGWIAGGEKLWVTLDGGETWTGQDVGTETQLRQVDFVDLMHGWALGEKLWATTDGGAHWTEKPLEFSPGLMSYTDTSTGFMTANSFVWRTTDGGSTWGAIFYEKGDRQAMYFVDSSHGWVECGAYDAPYVAATSDGGTNWVYGGLGSFNADIRDLFFLDATHGWAVGVALTYGPGWPGDYTSILGTSDGGATWVPQLAGNEYVFSVCFADEFHGWAVDMYGRILATKSGGWPPPKTTLTGASNGRWYNKALSLVLSSTPQPPGTSVVSLSYALQGVPQTVPGSSATLPVPVDPVTHVNDDSYRLTYYAVDNLDHEEWQHTLTFGIDTRRPTTKAPYAASAARGRTATLKYKVFDPRPGSPTATVTIKVKNRAGKVVRTLGPYRGKPVNTRTPLQARFTVPRTWRAGTYRFLIYARDAAGNPQVLPVGSNRLIVR